MATTITSQNAEVLHDIKDLVKLPTRGLTKIGQGVFSRVYMVDHPSGTLALKVFNTKFVTEKYREEELRVLNRVDRSEHCVQILFEFYDMKACEQRILMEHCAYGNLHQKFKQWRNGETVQVNLRNSWLYELAIGLAHLHSLGIIHRDLHPKNIVFGDGQLRETLKLCDFGFSIELDKAKTQGFPGDAAYASPEILDDNDEVTYTNKTDMWSFGCIMYEMFTTQKLFNQSEDELIDTILSEKAIPDLDVRGVFPNKLDFAERIQLIFKQLLNRNEPDSRPRADVVKQVLEEGGLKRGPVERDTDDAPMTIGYVN